MLPPTQTTDVAVLKPPEKRSKVFGQILLQSSNVFSQIQGRMNAKATTILALRVNSGFASIQEQHVSTPNTSLYLEPSRRSRLLELLLGAFLSGSPDRLSV